MIKSQTTNRLRHRTDFGRAKFIRVMHKAAGPSGRAVYGSSPAAIVGSNPTGGHGCLSVVFVVFCQVEASVTG
jgi:hypothetical protein